VAGISAAEYLGALRQVQLEMSLDQQCRQQYGNSAGKSMSLEYEPASGETFLSPTDTTNPTYFEPSED